MARKRETYSERIERLKGQGFSTAQARGHPRLGEPKISDIPHLPPRERAMERAVDLLENGLSLAAAARAQSVSRSRLAQYVKLNNLGRWNGRRWQVADRRVNEFPVVSQGRWVEAKLQGRLELSKAGWALNLQHRAVDEGDDTYLEPLIGKGVTDTNLEFIPFETDLNLLFQLFSMEEPVFPEIYNETDN